jgi:hypothetical protein
VVGDGGNSCPLISFCFATGAAQGTFRELQRGCAEDFPLVNHVSDFILSFACYCSALKGLI